MNKNRKLSAILFADIQGYTALMQKGEEKAMTLLSRFQEVTKAQVGAYQGEIIKSYGDGSLILFDSTVNAVQCSMAMQLEFAKDPLVPLRIGIHEGDVIHRDNDVFGNGVNIASRIESIGVTGAILISADVQKRIKNQESILTQSVGTFEFKNVDEPMEVFVIANEGFEIPTLEKIQGKLKTAKPKRKLKLGLVFAGLLALLIGCFYLLNPSKTSQAEVSDASIAVLPFHDMSSSKDQEYFGDGIAEEILNTLTKLTELKVTGRTSSFSFKETNKTIEEIGKALKVKYVLEGSIRKQNDKVRITAQLINSLTGFHVWSETFDRDFSDIFKIQDEVSVKIGSLILGELAPNQIDKITNNANIDPSAYELVLEANSIHHLQFYPLQKNSDFLIAEEKFKEAITIEPNYALAHAGLADLYDTKRYILTDSVEMRYYEDLKNKTIKVAMDLNPNLPYVQLTQGWVFLNRQIEPPDFEGAFRSFKKAYTLDTRNTSGLIGLFWLYQRFDLYEDCIIIMDKMLELNPNDIQIYQYKVQFSIRFDAFEEVVTTCKEGLKLKPDNVLFIEQMAYAYFFLNKKEEAITAINTIEQLDAEYFLENNLLQVRKALLHGNTEKAKSLNANSMSVDYFTKNHEKLDSSIYQLLENYQTNPITKEMSMYNQMLKHPYYQHLKEDEKFKKYLSYQKEKHDAAMKKLSRAAELFISNK